MKNLNNLGAKTAILSFGIGTVLLLLYAITHNEGIAVLGYLYLMGAFFTNLLIAIVLLILAIITKPDRMKNLKTIGFMLINIPIALLYVIIVFDYLKI